MEIEQCNNPETDYPLIDFQAGLLTVEEFERVESHLQNCQSCSSRIEHMRLIANGLRRQGSQMHDKLYGEHPSTAEIVGYVDDNIRLTESELGRVKGHIDTCPFCADEVEKIAQLNNFLSQNARANDMDSSATAHLPNGVLTPIFQFFKKPAIAYLLTAASLALLVNDRLSEQNIEDSSSKAVTTQDAQVNQPRLNLRESRTVTLYEDKTKNGTVIAKSIGKPLIVKIVRTAGESQVRAMVITPEPDIEHYRYSIGLLNDAGKKWALSDNFVDFGVTVSHKTVTNLSLDCSTLEDGVYILLFTAHDRAKPDVTYPVQYLFELITTDKLE